MLSRKEQEFAAYAQSFFTGEETVDRNLRLKLAHSFRVCNEMRNLAAAERFSPALTALALRTALLHDLSRFEQFSRFRTFNDAESFDHGDRSAELALEQGRLEELAPDERGEILTAIRAHNKLAIPAGLPERAQLLAEAVRDADKLDIIPILLGYLEAPENKSIVFGLSENPELSPKVFESVMKGECPRHRDMRTISDFVASKFLWVNDLNFGWSRSEFLRRGYLEKIMKHLPETPVFRQLYDDAHRRLTSA
ncbi:MAG: HD domain-containing protein [Lentisphaeria bacterium]|nr:HD domain-containing protein [Lentisphaeria bacterium]